jgi:hypothetical protein
MIIIITIIWARREADYSPASSAEMELYLRFTPRPLYTRGNRSRYPLDRRLDGPAEVASVSDVVYSFSKLCMIIFFLFT